MSYWRKCSTCKKEIGFEATYMACNVSTCNRKRTGLVFCSVQCWDAHVPLMNHRESWSIEKKSPSQDQWNKEQNPASVPRPAKSSPQTGGSGMSSGNKEDVLVVVSKLKAYIKDASEGMSTSADVMPLLSSKIRQLCDDAIIRARQAGRKTVMARDFQ